MGQYVEISDRMVHDWMTKSGARAYPSKSWQGPYSNDKPDFNFGLDFVDKKTIQKAVANIAPLVPRHYVVMEVKGNLTPAGRKENLDRFSFPHFKKVATIV